MKLIRLVPVFILLLGVALDARPPAGRFPDSEKRVGPGVPAFDVRPGYRVTLAADVDGEARFLEFDDAGTLYVSQPQAGRILALKDRDGDGVYETSAPFVTGRRTVHGLDWHDGWLWFTTTGAIFRARDTDGDGKADDILDVISEGSLPRGGGHWWRSICVTGQSIYTSIGDSGNINDESDTERQKIWRFNHDGSGKTLFATGIRNTEKLRIRPGTDELWGCDHGSDWYGKPLGDREGKQPVTDLNPPDELNHYVEGGFYGHPFIVGAKLPRLEYRDRKDIIDLAARTIPPALALGAHWASNGHTFLVGDYFPEHDGDLFIAFHGSWNSSERVGYCVQRVLFDKLTGRPIGQYTVVRTLGPDGEVLARPVDCVQAPDGSVLFSSNATQKIFRISRE
jgi:glucose/arabinose dehydrogenase